MIAYRKKSSDTGQLVTGLLLVVLTLAAVQVTGCSHRNQFVGTYLAGADVKIELLPDGTFASKEGEQATARGKYRIDGNRITFSPEWLTPALTREGMTLEPQTFNLENGTIIDPVRKVQYIKAG